MGRVVVGAQFAGSGLHSRREKLSDGGREREREENEDGGEFKD